MGQPMIFDYFVRNIVLKKKLDLILINLIKNPNLLYFRYSVRGFEIFTM